MAMMSNGSNDKKNLEVELNLMPVFDILSVCICFLLMTVVWIQVGAIETSQAIGGQSAAETPEKSSIWMTINEKNDVEFSYREAKKERKSSVVRSQGGQVNWNQIENRITALSGGPFETAVILPARQTKYDSVVRVMDSLKGVGIKDVGISPL